MRGTILGGPNNKDYSFWESTLGFSHVGKIPNLVPQTNESLWFEELQALELAEACALTSRSWID